MQLTVRREELQLVGATAMFVASKFEVGSICLNLVHPGFLRFCSSVHIWAYGGMQQTGLLLDSEALHIRNIGWSCTGIFYLNCLHMHGACDRVQS